jgi:hypothetical protein
MENNDHIFAEPPRELAAALGWRTARTAEEIDEAAAMELFSRTTAISNPWLAKPGENGVIQYGDDDAREEQLLRQPLEVLDKLFTPAAPARVAPKLGDLPVSPREDDDEERALYTPIRKLFYPDVTTIAPTEAAHVQFTKRFAAALPPPVPAPEAPLEKSCTGLDTFGEELEASLQKALDQAIQDCLPSEDESTFDFFRRVDARLQALGHQPILAVPTWISY